MTVKMTFSEALTKHLRRLKSGMESVDRRRLVASGLIDEQGKPTEFVTFLDRLYGLYIQDSSFFGNLPELCRTVAAGKMIWESHKRFPTLRTNMTHVCAVGAIILNGTIHRRSCMADSLPFFDHGVFWSDLLDEAAQLIAATRDLERIPMGKKNQELAFQGINPHQFRTARARWTRMYKALNADTDRQAISADPLLDTAAQLRCAIMAGTLWANTFNRYGFSQSISAYSVLSDSRLDIQGDGSNDLVVVGWNLPDKDNDAAWWMDSQGYPLTMVTRTELKEHAPDLLDHPDVITQLAGARATARQRVA